MASKSTYECFVCKANGFAGTLVYLAGKDDKGRAIRLEDDGVTPHQHKSKAPSQQVQQEQAQRQPDLFLEIKLISQKLDKVITLLTEEHTKHKESE